MTKALLLGFLLLTLTSCGYEIVDTGHVGVKTQFGKIIESGLPEGLHFYMPFTGKSINEVDMRVQSMELVESTFTKDNQDISVKFNVTYKFNNEKSELIYRNGNENYLEKVGAVKSLIGVMKEVVGQYDAETIVSKRNEVNKNIQEAVTKELAAMFVVVQNVEVTNFAFDKDYQRAIESKMIATQQAKEAENRTAQIKEEKEQAILKAQGEAEAMRIKSQALAANKNLVEFEAVQKWDGVLPVYMMGGTTPFINLSGAGKK